MSLVRGSRGLISFVHQFKPKFIEAGLLADAEMLAQVTAINQQIHDLAPVLNSPSLPDSIRVESSSADIPVEAMLRRHNGATYVFAVNMRDGKTTARFRVPGLKGNATATVLAEKRAIEVHDGIFEDPFQPWDVHLYKIQ